MEDLRVSVAEILGRPSEYRDVSVRAPLAGVATALARLADEPVRGALRAESVMEGILVTGRVEGESLLQCARCLAAFRSEVAVELCELFVAGGAADEDAYRISGTELDLEPMLRDALGLALPLNPVCSTDCKGICARCGSDLTGVACACAEDEVDPRWAPLAALRERLEG